MEDLPKPSTDMVERFERDWRAVAGAAHAGRVLIALSGGGDSSALLLLFAAAGRGGVFAATVDHGIRPEAAGEAVRAGALAAECGVPHVTLVGVLPVPPPRIFADDWRVLPSPPGGVSGTALALTALVAGLVAAVAAIIAARRLAGSVGRNGDQR